MATEGEPEPKRIRSSEPDLKVVIGSEDDNSGAGDGERKIGGNDGAEKQPASMVTKWYHSQALATKSKYIDTLLAAPMKESESRTITFPDITPATWELMMKFIDNPLASRTMKAKDVVKVATYYDKYEFTGWTELCDHVLEEYFTLSALTPNIDFIVDAVVVAKDANLHKSFVAGMPLIRDLLSSTDVPLGRTAFTVEHMRKLAPLMNEAADEARFLGGRYDVKSDAFPDKFVGDCSEYFAHQTLVSFISCIKLSGSNCDGESADGNFKKGNDYSFWLKEGVPFGAPQQRRKVLYFDGQGQEVSIRRRSKEEGWTIILKKASTDVETVVYRVPHSGNLPLPPSNGWVSVHPLTEGRLCLRYRLNGHMVEV